MTYDALLVFSFGGPEGPDDVLPFLRNVVAGRNVPDERLVEVATQYDRFGGRSPINDQCRELIEALRGELEGSNIDLPIYWGNRNWHPFLDDAVGQMMADGVERALVFVTSAFGSYSGCRQYRENLAAVGERLDGAPEFHKLRLFYNHPGFLEPVTERLRTALTEPASSGGTPASKRHLLFTAHSIPNAMAAACDYEAQLRDAASIVVERLGDDQPASWELVFQSRSGPPQVPWLEPDIGERIAELAQSGEAAAVTMCPLGFISDHMEVLFDLDTQAAEIAAEAGIECNRAPTVGTDPRFVTMIRELIHEQLDDGPRLFLGNAGPWPDPCPENHCVYTSGRPGGRPQEAGRPNGS